MNQLDRPLLLVHGLIDDNVYFRHAINLADKPHELLPMTGTRMTGAENPMISDREELHIIDFFNQHLEDPEEERARKNSGHAVGWNR